MKDKSDIKINIPKKVLKVLSLLQEAEYEAYIVGGCVRDALLNKIPKDYDITTNATPDQVKQIFYKTIDTGIEHGTVTVRIGGENFEITTYRIDGKYSDKRHPDDVIFTPNLKEDLSRRDFTINAMAYNDNEGLIDYFGGLEDLNDGVIRAVGNPKKRFEEDALRMVRAVRFSAVLGFEIEDETYSAIKNLSDNLKYISKERVQVELIKLLESSHPEKFIIFDETGLITNIIKEYKDYNDQEKEVVINALKLSSCDTKLKLAIILGFIKSSKISSDDINFELKTTVKKILRDLKFDNNTINDVSVIVSSRDLKLTTDSIEIRTQISKISKSLYAKYLEFRKMICPSLEFDITKQEQIFIKVVNKGDATSISELKITGKDLIDIGFKEGKEIGNVLNILLKEVIKDPKFNKKLKMIKFAKKELSRRIVWITKKSIKNGVKAIFSMTR